MGMQFTVSVTGKVVFEGLEASASHLDADQIIEDADGSYGSVEYSDAEVTEATVTVEARATASDIEVSAADLQDFDAEQALSEAISNYSASIRDAEFDITDSPTGFDVVNEVLSDREQTIAVYAALEAAGHSVE